MSVAPNGGTTSSAIPNTIFISPRPGQNPCEKNHPTFERVLSSEEAAELLKIHKKTLQRMAREGKIPGFRVGDLWRFRASELDAWARAQVSSSYATRAVN